MPHRTGYSYGDTACTGPSCASAAELCVCWGGERPVPMAQPSGDMPTSPSAKLERQATAAGGRHHPSTQGIRFPSDRTAQIATFSSQSCAMSWERVEGVSRSLPFSDLLTLTSCHMFVSVMS